MKYLRGTPHRQASTLLTHVRLGWKVLPGTNTLDYYEDLQIMDAKSFITLGHGANVIKLFTAVIYELDCLSLACLSSLV